MENFYQTTEWRKLRYRVLRAQGFKCCACGATKDDTILHVDHIKPRSKYPDLELVESNLQVLCEACNMGKSDIFEDDLFLKEDFATPEERRTKDSAIRILSKFPVYQRDSELTQEQAVKVKRHLEHELQVQSLRERARQLLKTTQSSFATEALERIMNLQALRRTSDNGDDGGNCA